MDTNALLHVVYRQPVGEGSRPAEPEWPACVCGLGVVGTRQRQARTNTVDNEVGL
ncbi:hypothetical protein PAI11_44540 [Patulibacter medicamentivorans]|uniref:Uncharacterized protein n=1 Tax=Patulibacter medicamentivorans TaxID=1097667 RepID=H0EC55_9ACTN|nr:hypothetical protein PAI11_44540 [Patulibacter medicamentivorans]